MAAILFMGRFVNVFATIDSTHPLSAGGGCPIDHMCTTHYATRNHWAYGIEPMHRNKPNITNLLTEHKGQVMKLRLSCYLVLLSGDSKTR